MDDPHGTQHLQNLRKAAKELLENSPGQSPREQPSQTNDVLQHELSVYQIELELQNVQLRETSQQLQEVHDRLLDLYDFAPVGYLTVDAQGTIREANLKAARLLGLDRSRLLQRRLGQYVAGESRSSLALLLERALSSEYQNGLHAELTLQRADGSLLPVRLDFLSRSPQTCRVALSDITTEKRAQEQLLQLNETLEKRVAERTRRIRELNQEFEDVTLAVTEDLSVSLRRVTSFMEVLRRESSPLLGTQAEHFGHVFRSVDRVEDLVGALLEYTRTSRMRVKVGAVDLNRVFSEVLKDLHSQTQERDVRLTCQHLPTVQADSNAMQLIFREILGNAVKFSAGREDARIQVDVQESESEFVLRFLDNGAGFNNRHRDKLFQVFKRLHPESAFMGNGMGLALVRRTCERFGARVWGEGKVGEGATFWVAWPKEPSLLE